MYISCSYIKQTEDSKLAVLISNSTKGKLFSAITSEAHEEYKHHDAAHNLIFLRPFQFNLLPKNKTGTHCLGETSHR